MDRIRKFYFRFSKYVLLLIFSMIMLVLLCSLVFFLYTKKYIYQVVDDIPNAYTVLVPGAMVWSNGKLSGILEDRVTTACDLYKKGKVKKFLLSGDHRERYYDEVNAMKNYLLKKGVPPEDIFLDHSGFDTYNSVDRAGKLYDVNDLIIVTQKFHLPRAVFIARCKKMRVYGMVSDKRKYKEIGYLKFREKLANVKAILELVIHGNRAYPEEKTPITGDSSKTFRSK